MEGITASSLLNSLVGKVNLTCIPAGRLFSLGSHSGRLRLWVVITQGDIHVHRPVRRIEA